jgi:hypothetical protein
MCILRVSHDRSLRPLAKMDDAHRQFPLELTISPHRFACCLARHSFHGISCDGRTCLPIDTPWHQMTSCPELQHRVRLR